MLDAARRAVAVWEWPLALQVAVVAVLCVAFWSATASAILLVLLSVHHERLDHFPLLEWWRYLAWYPVPGLAAWKNAKVLHSLRVSGSAATLPPLLIAGAAALGRLAPRMVADNARWATWRDLRRAGFSSRCGLYLGRVRGRFLRLGNKGSRKHIMVKAPTQSGKGVGWVIPAGLCDAKEQLSFVWFDPKFEAFLKTSGWQAEIGAKVALFAPLHPEGRTFRCNPCHYVRRNPDGTPTIDTWGDIEDIVHSLVPLAAGDEKQNFWNRTARKAFTAVLAFLAETPGAVFTIPEAIRWLKRPSAPATMRRMIEEARRGGRPYSEPCVRDLAEFLDGSADLHEGINRTINSFLGIFSNPRVAAAVSGNDFDLTRLNKERTALYIGVAPNEIAKLLPLLQLLFQQMIDLNVRTPPGTDPDVQFEVDVIYDEFVLLKAVEKIKDAFGYIAGWGFRFIPVFQSQGQLEGEYGRAGAKAITDNCKIEIVLAVDDLDEQKQASARLGTVKAVRHSTSRGLLSFGRQSASTSTTERPLLSPWEVGTLPENKAILFHGGMPGVLLRRLRYFDMLPFKRRLRPPVVIPPIAVNLALDDGSYMRKPAEDERERQPRGGALAEPPPDDPNDPGPVDPRGAARVPSRQRGKAPSEPAPAVPPLLSVTEAEAVLEAATDGNVDLATFALSPEAARAQIDRVILHLPSAKPKRGARPAAKAGSGKARKTG